MVLRLGKCRYSRNRYRNTHCTWFIIVGSMIVYILGPFTAILLVRIVYFVVVILTFFFLHSLLLPVPRPLDPRTDCGCARGWNSFRTSGDANGKLAKRAFVRMNWRKTVHSLARITRHSVPSALVVFPVPFRQTHVNQHDINHSTAVHGAHTFRGQCHWSRCRLSRPDAFLRVCDMRGCVREKNKNIEPNGRSVYAASGVRRHRKPEH